MGYPVTVLARFHDYQAIITDRGATAVDELQGKVLERSIYPK
ncbi:hypothetical protein ACFOGG_17150 [Brenneria rubrifaciens]